MNLDIMKATILAKTARTQLVLQKKSPEILLGGGIALGIGATIYACYATWKAKDMIEGAKFSVEMLEIHGSDAKFPGEEIPEDANIEEIEKIIVIQTGIEVIKLYLPVLIMSSLSIGMLLKSRNILNSRNAGLVAAYKVVDEAYKKYRERVREEFGDEVDNYIVHKKPLDKDIKLVDENGEEVNFEEALDLTSEEQNMVAFGCSQYAKFFDDSSPQWRPDNESNIFFLHTVQTAMNVELTVRGIVFLNQVYDALGIPRTKAGQVVGWVKNAGDDVIDFGIYNSANDYNSDFVNGYKRDHILLDFNVDGWVWDKI